LEQLAETYCADHGTIDALEAWLQLGIRLNLLQLDQRGYALKGIARKLAWQENDALVALAQEVTSLHYRLIMQTPAKLKQGALWGLEDQDGELIARSSRALEPFQTEAIDKTFPSSGAVRLLEIGCGSGCYMQYAAAKNPSLSAIGLELQPHVADMARRNIQGWGLQDRVTIEAGDIREREPRELFDIVTLYNNIYYVPVQDRVAFLHHIRGFLTPGGFLLLTTGCQGGNVGIELLNLWGASTAGCGRLASHEELVLQLYKSGYKDVQAIRLIPADKFYGFKAHNPEGS
jgi:SAM-dependent methyltransferase